MSDTVIFVANTQEMFKLQYTWGECIGRDLTRRLRTLEFRAKASAGVKTGMLRASINTKRRVVSDGLEGTVGSARRYAGAHHQGARPHIIRPRKIGGWLRFTVAGRVVFAKSVHHPGNRPNLFLSRHLLEAVR